MNDSTYQGVKALLERPVAYYPALARIGGGATAGIFLSQLLYWSPRSKAEGEWVYKTQEEWETETCLGRREQETARRMLKSAGLLEEKLQGIPARLYYRVNLERLWELLQNEGDPSRQPTNNKDGGKRQTGMAESAKLDGRKAPNYIRNTETTTETTIQREERVLQSSKYVDPVSPDNNYPTPPKEKPQTPSPALEEKDPFSSLPDSSGKSLFNAVAKVCDYDQPLSPREVKLITKVIDPLAKLRTSWDEIMEWRRLVWNMEDSPWPSQVVEGVGELRHKKKRKEEEVKRRVDKRLAMDADLKARMRGER